MDIDKVGGWINLTANIAVLVGIVSLALEVRHAGNSTEMQMQDSLAEGFNELAIELASDPVLARLYVIGLNRPERLTDVEAIQYGMFFRAYLNQQFRVFQLYQWGNVKGRVDSVRRRTGHDALYTGRSPVHRGKSRYVT